MQATTLGSLILLTLGAAAAADGRTDHRVNRETLVLSGSHAPGTPHVFDVLTNAAIDEQGNVIFQGTLLGGGSDNQNRSGQWIYSSGDLSLIYQGNVAPVLDGDLIPVHGAVDSRLSNGRVFAAERSSVPLGFLWQGGADGVTLVAVEGASHPGLDPGETLGRPQRNIGLLTDRALSVTGNVAYALPIESKGLSVGLGLWYGSTASQTLVARTGQQAPGFPESVLLAPGETGRLEFSDISDFDEIALVASLSGPDVHPCNDSAVWFGRPDSLAPVVRAGEQAAGLLDGDVFEGFQGACVDRTSWATIRATTVNHVTGVPREGLWVSDGTSTSLIAATGQPAPGFQEDDVVFVDIHRTSTPNSFGDIAFTAETSTGDIGVWAGGRDDLQLIAYSGQPLPGMPASSLTVRNYDRVELDSSGVLKFSGLDNGVSSAWLRDPNGVFHSLYEVGGLIEVSSGDVRQIRSWTHRNDHVNFSHQVVATLFFEDGTSGVFRWQLVPEPSTVVLLAGLGVALGACRHRHSFPGAI